MNIKDLINGLKAGSLDWKNFSPNVSALGYDADIKNFMNYMGSHGMSALGFNTAFHYDADAFNYSGPPAEIMGDKKALAAWLDQQVNSGAMTTYKMRVFYTPGPGLHGPVDVTFFATAFNTGTFDGSGNLVFTNSTGDTATIQGLTTNGIGQTVSMKTLFNLTETEPFTVGFIRMRPKTVDQLDNAINIIKESQYGASQNNSIAPDDYVDPYQYQLLRVDVPLNSHASKKHGWSWTIDEDQTGNGISMTLFIPKTLDPTKELSGKDQLRNLNSGVQPPFYTPTHPSGQLNAVAGLSTLASNDTVKSVMNSGVAPAMGQQIIKSIAPAILAPPTAFATGTSPFATLGMKKQ